MPISGAPTRNCDKFLYGFKVAACGRAGHSAM
jgi:hypothetical protein